MKRSFSLLLAILIVLSAVPLTAGAAGTAFYVSPDGSDNAEGSLASPLKTLEQALEKVNAVPEDKGEVTVYLRGLFRADLPAQ